MILAGRATWKTRALTVYMMLAQLVRYAYQHRVDVLVYTSCLLQLEPISLIMRGAFDARCCREFSIISFCIFKRNCSAPLNFKLVEYIFYINLDTNNGLLIGPMCTFNLLN